MLLSELSQISTVQFCVLSIEQLTKLEQLCLLAFYNLAMHRQEIKDKS